MSVFFPAPAPAALVTWEEHAVIRPGVVIDQTAISGRILDVEPSGRSAATVAGSVPASGNGEQITAGRVLDAATLEALNQARQGAVAAVNAHVNGTDTEAARLGGPSVGVARRTTSATNTRTADLDATAPRSGEPDTDTADVASRRTGGREANADSSHGRRAVQVATTTSSTVSSPAEHRAFQVESALRLEQVTGQPVAVESASRTGQSNGAGAQGASSGADARLLAPLQYDVDGPADDRFSGRLLRGLSAMLNQRGGVMTMRLDPPELGEMRIQMSLTRGVVSAEFQAANQQAHEMINRHLATLRTSLESQGLTVERLHVQLPQTGQSHATPEDSNDGQSQQRGGGEQQQQSDGGSAHQHHRRHGEDGGRFPGLLGDDEIIERSAGSGAVKGARKA